MSQLSLIIENQNEVPIDQSFLQKCKNNNEKPHSKAISAVSRMLSNKQLKLNKNYVKKKSQTPSPLSSKNLESVNQQQQLKTDQIQKTQIFQDSEQIKKIQMRLEALQQYQKRMQETIGRQFFQLQNEIYKKQREQSTQFQQVRKLKTSLQENKRNIGDLLNTIAQYK